jgi:hypothetical protein
MAKKTVTGAPRDSNPAGSIVVQEGSGREGRVPPK